MILAMLFQNSIAQNPIVNSSLPSYEFIENRGQWHPAIRYKSEIPFGEVFLEATGLMYKLTNAEDYNRIQQWKHDNPAQPSSEVPRRHAVRLQFANTQFSPKLVANKVQGHYYNYFVGSDRSKWSSKIHPAAEIVYKNVYPDIDYEINGQKDLKYQWVIRNPTFDKISKIGVNVFGADKISIENNKLVIKTTAGTITDESPFAYQLINGKIQEIKCVFTLVDSTFGFEILGDFSPNIDLIIDPKLIFSTYSGSKGDNFGFTATYDENGSLLAGGIINNDSGEYPVTPGAFDTSFNGGSFGGNAPAGLSCDISISKYDSAGAILLWATYLGGSNDEYPHSLVADRNNDLFIYGTTYSNNFPTSIGCFDSTHAGGTDIYVTKLSSDGTKLLGSTYIGGSLNDGLTLGSILKHNYADDYRGDILTDDNRHAFIASVTQSDQLPVKNEIQSAFSGAFSGYLFELNEDCSKLEWATYLGGNGQDAFYSIKLDNHQNIYVAGGTTSSNLPASDTTYQKTKNSGIDGVIAMFDKTTKALKRLTYWGTSAYDQIYFIDIDSKNRIYATGQTEGNVSKSTNAYGEDNKGQFIFRIDTLLLNVDLQTTFGNQNNYANLSPSAFLVDVCDHIYFSGWGSSVDRFHNPGNTLNMPVTSDAHQIETDGNDFYIIVLDKDASSLLYATYFGGDVTDDHVDGGTSRFDKKGVMYQSVCSSCPPSTDGQQREVSDFPTSNGAVFKTNPSVRCSNASFKIDLQIKTAVIADFVATPSIGCGPLDVSFTNKSVLGDSLFWEFGDGTTSSEINPKHTYNEPGTYIVKLTVIDSNSCNISDSYERIILVFEGGEANINASYEPCTDQLTLENNSTNATNFLWDFGDGSTSTEQLPNYRYTDSGTFKIVLTINKGSYCESADTVELKINNQANPEITLYNVFTPNDDNVNDCFKMEGKNLDCADYLLKIYNRWGEKVFETEDPNECWNGKVFNTGVALPESTYFYILNLGDQAQKETYSGIVELIR